MHIAAITPPILNDSTIRIFRCMHAISAGRAPRERRMNGVFRTTLCEDTLRRSTTSPGRHTAHRGATFGAIFSSL